MAKLPDSIPPEKRTGERWVRFMLGPGVPDRKAIEALAGQLANLHKQTKATKRRKRKKK